MLSVEVRDEHVRQLSYQVAFGHGILVCYHRDTKNVPNLSYFSSKSFFTVE